MRSFPPQDCQTPCLVAPENCSYLIIYERFEFEFLSPTAPPESWNNNVDGPFTVFPSFFFSSRLVTILLALFGEPLCHRYAVLVVSWSSLLLKQSEHFGDGTDDFFSSILPNPDASFEFLGFIRAHIHTHTFPPFRLFPSRLISPIGHYEFLARCHTYCSRCSSVRIFLIFTTTPPNDGDCVCFSENAGGVEEIILPPLVLLSCGSHILGNPFRS